jgi:hypothetical protein
MKLLSDQQYFTSLLTLCMPFWKVLLLKQDKAEAKRNETKKSSINKKTKQTLTKRFFLHETTIHKMPVAD